jgi:hypothetical protein
MAVAAINGSTGGFHVPNYHRNSNTGNVPAPIQAGKVYGPVTFPTPTTNPFGGATNGVPVVRPTNFRTQPTQSSYPVKTTTGNSFMPKAR